MARSKIAVISRPDTAVSVLGIEDKAGIAREAKVSLRTIDNLMASRAIPFFKIGRLVRFDVAKVKTALCRFEVKEVSRKAKSDDSLTSPGSQRR